MGKLQNIILQMKKNWIVYFLLFSVFLIFIQIILRIFIPNPEKIMLINPEIGSRLSPNQEIKIELSYSPRADECQISLSPEAQKDAEVKIQNENILISPKIGWPLATDLSIFISCPTFSQNILYQVKAAKDLSESEITIYQSGLDFEFAQTTKEYLSNYPFLEYFPIQRENYRLLFLRSQIKILVSSETLFSDEEKEIIRSKERKEIDKIGVPKEIPIIFTDELNSATIN